MYLQAYYGGIEPGFLKIIGLQQNIQIGDSKKCMETSPRVSNVDKFIEQIEINI